MYEEVKIFKKIEGRGLWDTNSNRYSIRGKSIDNDPMFAIAQPVFDPIVHITCNPDFEH